MAINYENLRKVLFVVDDATDEAQMIVTDAPKEAIERWCRRWNELYKNEMYTMFGSFDTLKAEYFVQEIDISDEQFGNELIDTIGYDEIYDYNLYYDDYDNEGKENPRIESQFTDDEMYILSDGLLALIRSTCEALKLTYDKESIEKLQAAVQKYQRLNEKVCSYIK